MQLRANICIPMFLYLEKVICNLNSSYKVWWYRLSENIYITFRKGNIYIYIIFLNLYKPLYWTVYCIKPLHPIQELILFKNVYYLKRTVCGDHFCHLIFRFLDVLAARKDPLGLSGEVLIDGAPQPSNFKCLSGYVVQVQQHTWASLEKRKEEIV